MKFCSNCGSAALEFRVPDGDTLPRHVCAQCGTIHYQNPKIVVGCLPEWQGQRAALQARDRAAAGLWTLPAGFLENGETLAAGALRETLEEADARVAIDSLYTVISLPHINQVYVMFRSTLADLDFGPGTESLEVALFAKKTFPGINWLFARSAARCATISSTASSARFRCTSAPSIGASRSDPTSAAPLRLVTGSAQARTLTTSPSAGRRPSTAASASQR